MIVKMTKTWGVERVNADQERVVGSKFRIYHFHHGKKNGRYETFNKKDLRLLQCRMCKRKFPKKLQTFILAHKLAELDISL